MSDTIHLFTAARIAHYAATNNWPRYGKGWTLRANRAMAASLAEFS